jgi:Glycosyl transferases group 1/Glycosyltransferase Family 4
MRILHLDAGREMRGGQWQVLRLIEGLEAAGIESTLLAREGAPLFTAARKLGWRVQPLGLTRALMHVRRHDLIHAHDARTHTLGALLRGRPLIVARRVAFCNAGPWPARTISLWKYQRASRYIAVSEFVKAVLITGGVPAEKISLVYDGVPIVGQEVGQALSPGNRILTLANAADPAKGAPLAAEAAKIAGVPLTPSANLEADLPHASLFVYITHSEGLGSAALLAMSAGVPVVASNVGGLPEAVHHGETGLLVPNDPAAIAAAIRRLVDNPDLARRMGAAGRRAVLANFTVDHMVRRTMEVYRQVLA